MQQRLKISGMSCAACSSSIERSLKRKDYIHNVEVDLINANALIDFNPQKTTIEDIIKHINKLGYGAEIWLDKSNVKNKLDSTLRDSKDYFVAIIFAIPLFVLSMGSMSFAIQNEILFCVIEIALLLPILYAGRRIYQKGFLSLIRFVPNMDSLIFLGSGSAIAYSVYMMILYLFGENRHLIHNVYFESAGVIIAVIMLGKKLEEKATNNAKMGLNALINLAPKTALKQINEYQTLEVPIDSIKVDDIIVVPKGVMTSVDGILLNSEARFDDSIISGESKIKMCKKGDKIFSGSINVGEQIRIIASASASDSMIGKIISLMQGIKKAPIARIADIVSAYFVPSVIAIATISAIVWFALNKDLHFSFIILTSTLLISCPCALGLATPLSILVANSIASKKAIYFKSGESLEAASKITVVVFDKTGTLTQGNLEVIKCHFARNVDKEKMLSYIYTLESSSEHTIAKAITSYIKNNINITQTNTINDIRTNVGEGISGVVDNNTIKIGNLNYIFKNHNAESTLDLLSNFEDSASIATSPYTLCYFSVADTLCGVFELSDELAPNATTLIANLDSLHIKSVILSGDNENSVKNVALRCGIKEFYHSQLPVDKLKFIESLQDSGECVAFIGDGINDALAISRANIGISLSNANDIAIKQADIIILNSDLNALYHAILLSRKTLKNIKENLAFAFLYNICAIPIAVGIPHIFGFNLTLNPMIAGIAMGLSSISVVLNAMRLKWKYM